MQQQHLFESLADAVQDRGDPTRRITSNAIHRSTDPKTSRQAAEQIADKITCLADKLLLVLQHSAEPLTANEAAARAVIDFGGIAESYRKRVRDLGTRIRPAGERVCRVTGNKAETWEVV